MALDAAKLAYAGAFVIFAGAMYRYAGARIVGMLDHYSANIRKQLEEARTLREEAQALLASYRRKQRDVQVEAQDLLARTETEASALRATALAELERELARREQAALDRINLAAARARQDVQAETVRAVMATLETLLRERAATQGIDPQHLLRLVEQTPFIVAHGKPGGASRVSPTRAQAEATPDLASLSQAS
jgi:F-type H+-transporting ATPase subunit b